MHKIKFQGKFFKSLNFRIMLFLLLMGTVPALIIGGVFLMSYERPAMAQLRNDDPVHPAQGRRESVEDSR